MSPPQSFRSQTHRYRVTRELSGGGQGKTLLVEREDEPGSSYVLKLLRLEHVDDWKQVELFEREVTTLAALDHPGIPRLVDRIVEDERTAGIVQTKVEGHTLAEQIADHGPLAPPRFERIVRQSLEILAYLHQQVPPVMHRDINPRNVMITDERTYLIDFGAVRVGGKTDMTSVGTFGYMAPEQIIGRPVPASDMYGLGMTLVCLAERREVGDLPIDAKTGQVDRARLLRGVEPRLRDVVLAMIEPGLEERLADPQLALARLDEPVALERRGSSAVASAVPVAASEGAPVSRSLLMGVAVIALMVCGATVFAMFSRLEPASVEVPSQAPEVAAPRLEVPPPPRVVPEPPAVPEAAPVKVSPPPVPLPPVAKPKIVPAELDEDNSAQLELMTKPAGAEATFDGDVTCTTPCSARLPFGEHRVIVEKDGQRVERTVMVLEDMKLQVSLSP